jgi:hypothetical protein
MSFEFWNGCCDGRRRREECDEKSVEIVVGERRSGAGFEKGG